MSKLKLNNWLISIFTPAYTTKQELVESIITDSTIGDRSHLQLAVSSDKETIRNLSELLKNTCYMKLADKAKENIIT